MKKDQRLYKEVNVWKRIDENTLLRYRCFQIFADDKYCVQSVDCYRFPFKKEDLDYFDRQFLELLVEDSPAKRVGKLYESLEEAISAHDSAFQT